MSVKLQSKTRRKEVDDITGIHDIKATEKKLKDIFTHKCTSECLIYGDMLLLVYALAYILRKGTFGSENSICKTLFIKNQK